jgi:hypothetical protein
MDLQGPLVSLINQVIGFFSSVVTALRASPGGFGLVVIPLGIIWGIALMASRRRR